MYRALARLMSGLSLLIAALLLTGCGADDTAHRQTFPALGTLITIEIHDTDAGRAERATRAVAAYLEHIGQEWYAWGDGELGRVNAALERGEPAPVSAELAAPIRRALEILTALMPLAEPDMKGSIELELRRYQTELEEQDK